jgi:hypothetical protein
MITVDVSRSKSLTDFFILFSKQKREELCACGYVFAFLIIQTLRAARMKFGEKMRKINKTVAMEIDPYVYRVELEKRNIGAFYK